LKGSKRDVASRTLQDGKVTDERVAASLRAMGAQ